MFPLRNIYTFAHSQGCVTFIFSPNARCGSGTRFRFEEKRFYTPSIGLDTRTDAGFPWGNPLDLFLTKFRKGRPLSFVAWEEERSMLSTRRSQSTPSVGSSLSKELRGMTVYSIGTHCPKCRRMSCAYTPRTGPSMTNALYPSPLAEISGLGLCRRGLVPANTQSCFTAISP